jgi:hypothetical protein
VAFRAAESKGAPIVSHESDTFGRVGRPPAVETRINPAGIVRAAGDNRTVTAMRDSYRMLRTCPAKRTSGTQGCGCKFGENTTWRTMDQLFFFARAENSGPRRLWWVLSGCSHWCHHPTTPYQHMTLNGRRSIQQTGNRRLLDRKTDCSGHKGCPRINS